MARISLGELERRWALVRERMDTLNLDALIAMSHDRDAHGGYAQWLTGEPFGYTVVIVFHRSDLMTRFEHGSESDAYEIKGDNSKYRGVGKAVRTPEFCAVSYSHKQLIENVAREVARRNYRRVGLLGPERMGHGLVEAIEGVLCGKAEIVDETEFLDRAIAIKSDEEIALLKENVAIQTAAFKKLLAEVRPGMRDIDAENLVRSETYSLGGTGGLCSVGSAPLGQPAIFMSANSQRKIQKGDQLTLLLETKGPDGYYTEMGRTIVLGRASNELRDAAAIVTEAIANAQEKLRIGGTFAEVIKAHNAFMMQRGLAPERRVLAHGSGYDIVQRPLIREDEGMRVAKNMFFAIHPTFATRSVFAWMCDNFMIESTGASKTLHGVPQEILEVDV